MADGRTTLLAFDLYGTLLSTGSVSEAIASEYGPENAASVAALWRRYQIEYTFRLNSMKQYYPFETVTKQSLVHALSEHGMAHSDEAIQQVMLGYDRLTTFDDVFPALQKLEAAENIKSVIFSNGTRQMIENSVKGSRLSQISNAFSQLISVDHLQRYKPAPEVYKYLANCTEMTGKEDQIWLVSGNPFDIVGARAVGMNAIWVDRAGTGWLDKLGPEPSKIIRSLEDLAGIFAES